MPAAPKGDVPRAQHEGEQADPPHARHVQASDLRSAAALANQAVAGLVDLVEAVHARVVRLPGWPASDKALAGRTSGITGLVYKTVRGVNTLVGGSANALLAWLQPVLAPVGGALASQEREAVLAALNGVLGDHLAATASPLATPMTLRSAGRTLTLERSALAKALPAAGQRVLVLLHGLCMNDLQWRHDGHDHGAMLARASGWTPVYLHYNTGLHISVNGERLAEMLELLAAQWPGRITRLALLGHSMGGLVARSAVHAGQQAGHAWTAQLSDLVCLGSPHHGAPLERAGHGLDLLLSATPYSAPFARLGKLRSAGIGDLRHGRLLASDGATAELRTPVPLPSGVRCCTAAASLGSDSQGLQHRVKQHLVGDGLVPLDSALGRHANARFDLGFATELQWVGHGMGHLDLLSHADVASQLQRWLA